MSSLFRDLDFTPPELRYAPPIREPHVQAAVDMERRMIYGLYEREVMPCDSAGRAAKATDVRPASATPADRIAELTRELVYGDMMELARSIIDAAEGSDLTLENLPKILWNWATSEKEK